MYKINSYIKLRVGIHYECAAENAKALPRFLILDKSQFITAANR